MTTAAAATRASRLALGALILGATIAVAGCSAIGSFAPPATSPTASPMPSTDGFLYTDNPTGYAITFPAEPDVEQVDIYGQPQKANVATYADADTFYLSRGEVQYRPIDP